MTSQLPFETLRAFQCFENIVACDDGTDNPVIVSTVSICEQTVLPQLITTEVSVKITIEPQITPEPKNEPEELADFDMTKKKRSKKPKKTAAVESTPATEEDYKYADLLKGFYLKTPSKTFERKKLPAVNLLRIGSKRTRIVNFHELCSSINRTEQHVNTFFAIELGTMTSIGAPNNHLTIRGILSNRQIEDLMLSYMKQYVRCDQCKDWNTKFTRENDVTLLSCSDCKAYRTLPVMKRGFQAKTTFTNDKKIPG